MILPPYLAARYFYYGHRYMYIIIAFIPANFKTIRAYKRGSMRIWGSVTPKILDPMRPNFLDQMLPFALPRQCIKDQSVGTLMIINKG